MSNSTQREIVAVLDVGSSKVVCFIGYLEEGGGVRIIGAGYHASAGLKAGAVVDMELAEDTIRHAVSKAEKSAGFAISAVYVNVSSKSLKSRHINIETKFASAEVADKDLRRVVDTAMAEFSQPEQTIVHALPLNWTLDEDRGIRDPRGMCGQNLGVDMHFVTCNVGMLRNLAHCIERCHLRIAGMVTSPYAAGEAVLVEDELDLGVTLIDMGAGITTVSVFRDQALVFVDAIEIGGNDLTRNIARDMTTPWEAAERIKAIYGSALDSTDEDKLIVPCPPMGAQDELKYEPIETLTAIVRAHTEQTFEALRHRLKVAGIEEFSGGQIVLTGGAAQLLGAAQLADIIFDKRVRVGRPHGLLGLPDAMHTSDFAVASGLIKHVFQGKTDAISGAPDLSGVRIRQRRYSGGSVMQSLKWFRDNF